MTIPYTLTPDATPPRRAHPTDAGLDLATTQSIVIFPGQHMIVDTGVSVAIPPNHVGMVFVRSSTGIKQHITLSNGTGIIDSGYTGTIKLSLHNTGRYRQSIKAGDYIAQLLTIPITTPQPVEVQHLDATPRGHNGIGSTNG